MTNYYIQYPISLQCNLHCDYCYHVEDRLKPWNRGFTCEQFKIFHETHLSNSNNIVCFHGGDIAQKDNVSDIIEYSNHFNNDKLELLTNGLGQKEQYERLMPYIHRIDRVVATYHRMIIDYSENLKNSFIERVLWLRDQGFPVIVRELLTHELHDDIEQSINFWTKHNIQVTVQDFRGFQKGRDFLPWKAYDDKDYALISPEYKHINPCNCKHNYKNVLIRGGWFQPGDIIACWENAAVIGSVQHNIFNQSAKVMHSTKGINIEDVPLIYKGTFIQDTYHPTKTIETLYVRKNREKKVDDPFYIKINDLFRISRDKYNITVTKKMVTESTGKVYEFPQGYFGKFQAIADFLKEKITKEERDSFLARVKDFKVAWKDGKMTLTYPIDFAFDTRDILKEEAVEKEDEKDPTD